MQSKKTLWDSLYLGIYDILSNRIIKTNENEDPDVVAKWASREFADVLTDSVESFINTGGINLDSVEELVSYFSDGSANSAVKLKDTHTFWGQPFNGTQDVLGDLKNVGKISASGNISTLGGVSAGGSSDLFELFSSGYTSITEVGTGNGVAFIEPDVASIKVHKANFLTEHQSLSAYYTSSEVNTLLSTKVAIEDLSQSILDITDPLYLKLSGGNLTGPLSGTTASFTGNVHSDSNISANGGVSAGGISDLGYSSPVIDLYYDWSDNAPTNKALGAALGIELHNTLTNLGSISHSHSNKAILDGTTASFLTADKTKLEGIADNANNYVLPYATTAILGGVVIGSNIDVSSGIISVKDASTSLKGVVKLSDSVSSTSSSLSATSKAVKIAWDLANSKWAWNENEIKVVVVNRSLTADKLTAPISLWGQYFDGSSDVNGDLHSTGNISADGGVYAGGIGDLFEAITSGYNDILPHPNDTGNAVTSITSNGGSTLYYRREKSFSEVGHNHDTAYSLLGHVHDDRYYTEVEISNILSGLTSATGYNKSNWDTAFSWGDHQDAGYALDSDLTAHTGNSTIHITATERTNWNATFGWGNHAIAGYAAASALSTHTANVSNPHSVTKAQVGLGNVENTKLSTWAGTTNITTLGTISGGTWHGSIVEVSYGGTGRSSITINKMLYASSANVFSEIPTTSFGRGLLNTTSGTMIVGLNADLLDGFHGVDFVNVASTQEITGSKTFTKTLNILESLNVSSNIHAGGNISADGGVSAGGISDLFETTSSGFNDIEYIGSGNIVTNVDKNVSSLKVFKSFSVYSDTEIDTIISTEVTNRNTAITDAINQLDVESVGGSGKYISAISEANGKISATASIMPTLLSQFTDNLGSSPVHTHSQYLLATLKGTANGLAELDSNGLVPASQLPSYVDDVLTYSSLSVFPSTGVGGKIYIASDTNLTYRWSGTAYVEISKSLALGENDSTAYRGDRGKIAYDHSQITGSNPHGLTKSILGLDYADGAQVNVLEGVELNGTALNPTPTSKIVKVNACTSITVPTGLSASSLDASGLIALSFAEDYAIPTTANITQIGTNKTNIDTLQSYFSSGSAKTAIKLYTARNIWGQPFDGSAEIKDKMLQYCTGLGYSTTRQIELSSGLVKVTNTLNAASASFSGNVTDAAIHYFANGTTYYVNASGAAKFNGTNTGALTATTGEFTGKVHTTNQVVGDAGVFAGGIGDLGYITPVIDLYTNWSDNAPVNKALSAELGIELHNNKVDKVTGYSLSKNNLSDALLSDLNANTAARHSHSNKTLLDTYTQTEANLASAVSQKHSHSNKSILDATTASFLTADKTKLAGIAAGANNYSLPTASSTVLGGIKVGSRLTISSGVLSADIQSDNNFTSTYKNKLDGIATGANLYVHPSYTARTSGLYKVTVDASGHVSAVVAVAKSDITALGIPAQDTVYVHPSSGVTAGTYRSVTVEANGHVTAGTNPTTLAGYGITDAKIVSGVITLGANTITPLVTHQAIYGLTIKKNGNQVGSVYNPNSASAIINITDVASASELSTVQSYFSSGSAKTALKLTAAVAINGTAFDGSAAITTSKWGTARAVGIVNSDGTGTAVTVSIDGSGNVNLKLPASIKAALDGNAATANKVNRILTRGTYLTGNNFDGSANTTWSVDATSANTASKVVARDVNGDFSARVISGQRIYGDAGVFSGGIGDLSEYSSGGYNDILPYPNETGNAVTSISDNGGSTLYYHLGSFSLSGHNHDDRYYTETEIGNILTAHANLTTVHGLGASAFHADSYFALAGHNHSTLYQPLDADLTAIAGLAGTSGLLKKTAANTWALDTNTYLTGNQTISLTGIITGSGTTSIVTSIADAALSIAKTSGLQSALNAKMATSAYPDLVAIEALSGTSGFLKKTAANTWSLDTNVYLTGITKAQVEAVLTGAITSHTHNYQAPLTGTGFVKSAAGVISYDTNTYLTTHQTIYGLTIQKNGDTIATYTPNSASKTINISDVASASTLASHIANKSNPHAVTKAQVGLGSVENAAASTLYVPLTRTVAGLALSGNIATASLQTALGLGSNAYSSTAYLPLTGGTLSGALRIQKYDVRTLPISSVSEISDGVLILCPAGAGVNNNVLGSLYIERSSGNYGIEKIDFGYSTGSSTVSYSTYIDVKNGVSGGDGVWTFVYFTYNSVQYIGLRRTGQAYWATTCTFAGHNLYTGTNSMTWIPTANGTVDDTLSLKVNTSISGTLSAPTFKEAGATLASKYLGLHATADKVVINNSFTGTYPLTVNVSGVLYSHNNITYNGATGTLTAAIFAGALSGNASTATAFSAAKSIALTGDISGSASSTGGWSIATTIGAGKVTNAMLAGAIENGKLVNSTIDISGQSVGLGGTISQTVLRTALGLRTRAASMNGTTYYFVSYDNYGTTSFNTYAPTAAGTSGQLLISTGGTPSWATQGSGGGIDADKLDNMHAVEFVNVANTQTITGRKTFSNDVVFNENLVQANAKGFYGRNTTGDNIQLLSTNSNNETTLGYGARVWGYKTVLQGSVIQAVVGSGVSAFDISALGNMSIYKSVSIADNLNVGGIIQGAGGVFAGGIADLGGNEYAIPAASASSIGGIKIGYTNNAKNYKVALDASGNAYVNVPWVDTTYQYGDYISISGTTINNAGTWYLAESSQNGYITVVGGQNPSGYDIPIHGLGSAAYTNSSDYATASHVHGNITNGGKIGSTAALPIITGTGGLLQTGSFGSSAGTFCQGNDSRLSNSRPASDVSAWAKAATKPSYTYSEVGAAPAIHSHSQYLTGIPYADTTTLGGIIIGVGFYQGAGDGKTHVSYGAIAGTACEGNDSRLSDARTPTTHSHSQYIEESSWTTPSLTNGTQGTTWGSVRYRKVGTNLQIDGSFTFTWNGSSQYTIFTLPTGYRPINNLTGVCYCVGGGMWRYWVKTDGSVVLVNSTSFSGSSITSSQTYVFDNLNRPLN